MSTKVSRKRIKFTSGAKVTLAALSMIGFVGGWDLLARLDRQDAAASPQPAPAGSQNQHLLPSPTPWPSIPPLAEIPPIPTLVPTVVSLGDSLQPNRQSDSLADPAPVQMAPVPTLAPLPALAPLPPIPELPPPPPPPAQTWTGGGNASGGS